MRALCRCCDEPRQLRVHARLASTHLVCPETRATYEDRGDGLFEPDGSELDAAWELDEPAGDGDPGTPDLLSDRPARTGPKTRISLERATFAGEGANRRDRRGRRERDRGGASPISVFAVSARSAVHSGGCLRPGPS